MSIFIVDLILEVIHRLNDKGKKKTDHFLKNLKFLFRLIIILLLLSDLIYFYSMNTSLRIGRYTRPC